MESVLVPIRGAWLDSRIPDIAARLRERDRHLAVNAHCTKNGRVFAYEVTWKGQIIGLWEIHEVDQILRDVELMDQTTPGHEPVLDRIDRHNAEKEDQARRQFHDSYMQMLEHGAALVRDTTEGRHFFGQAGVGDGKKKG